MASRKAKTKKAPKTRARRDPKSPAASVPPLHQACGQTAKSRSSVARVTKDAQAPTNKGDREGSRSRTISPAVAPLSPLPLPVVDLSEPVEHVEVVTAPRLTEDHLRLTKPKYGSERIEDGVYLLENRERSKGNRRIPRATPLPFTRWMIWPSPGVAASITALWIEWDLPGLSLEGDVGFTRHVLRFAENLAAQTPPSPVIATLTEKTSDAVLRLDSYDPEKGKATRKGRSANQEQAKKLGLRLTLKIPSKVGPTSIVRTPSPPPKNPQQLATPSESPPSPTSSNTNSTPRSTLPFGGLCQIDLGREAAFLEPQLRELSTRGFTSLKTLIIDLEGFEDDITPQAAQVYRQWLSYVAADLRRRSLRLPVDEVRFFGIPKVVGDGKELEEAFILE